VVVQVALTLANTCTEPHIENGKIRPCSVRM